MMCRLGEMIMLALLEQKLTKVWFMLSSIHLQVNTYILIMVHVGVISKTRCSNT